VIILDNILKDECFKKRYPIILVCHNNKWIKWYDEMEVKLSKLLKDIPVNIYHIGSSAIPNMKSKNIIDILIETIDDRNFGNIVKIRRINDMVHVSLSHPDNEGLQLELDSSEYCVILANKEISKGFTPMKAIISPVTSIEEDVKLNSNRINTQGLAVFKIKDNRVTLKVYGSYINTGYPTELHINNFSYFTEDPFPTNLH